MYAQPVFILLQKAEKLAHGLLKLGKTGELSPTYMPELYEMEKKVGKLLQSLSIRNEGIRAKRMGLIDFVNEVNNNKITNINNIIQNNKITNIKTSS